MQTNVSLLCEDRARPCGEGGGKGRATAAGHAAGRSWSVQRKRGGEGAAELRGQLGRTARSGRWRAVLRGVRRVTEMQVRCTPPGTSGIKFTGVNKDQYMLRLCRHAPGRRVLNGKTSGEFTVVASHLKKNILRSIF